MKLIYLSTIDDIAKVIDDLKIIYLWLIDKFKLIYLYLIDILSKVYRWIEDNLAISGWEQFCPNNDMFRLVIGVPVNWHISLGVLEI